MQFFFKKNRLDDMVGFCVCMGSNEAMNLALLVCQELLLEPGDIVIVGRSP